MIPQVIQKLSGDRIYKIIWNGYVSSSVSGMTKVPRKATALKRWIVIESRCKRKLASRVSPVMRVRLSPLGDTKIARKENIAHLERLRFFQVRHNNECAAEHDGGQ